MGTPNYPDDPGRVMRDLKRGISDTFTGTSVVNPNARPWMPMTVASDLTASWPSVTGTSFASLLTVAGVRSHPNVALWLRVNAPAAGSEVRVTTPASSVLYGPVTFTSGLNSSNILVPLDPSIAYYGEFNILVHARSLAAGQVTSVMVARAYGRS